MKTILDTATNNQELLESSRWDRQACLVADDQTAQALIDQAAANGLTKTELLEAIQALYGDADEAVDWPDIN